MMHGQNHFKLKSVILNLFYFAILGDVYEKWRALERFMSRPHVRHTVTLLSWKSDKLFKMDSNA
jgi:hypothetical protein